VPLRVCNCGQNLWKKQILTAGFDRGGTTFPCPLTQADHLGTGLPSGPIPMVAPFYFASQLSAACIFQSMYRVRPRSRDSWTMSPQKRAILFGLVISAVAFGTILSLARLH
jgi:hypothetical protein